ncbi:MAG: rhomboid family intramembrane serine protease [Leptospiraceae bacterium]|nr:rhomboid family intramembrane serine protease [Leptospiraceae bacterium]
MVYIIDLILPLPLNSLGIIPRTFRGIFGIPLSPLLHSGLSHLISNSVPIFILSLLLLSTYRKMAMKVYISVIFLGGLLVWIFARGGNHIGASGLIYGLAGFLVTCGILFKNLRALFIALITILLYGGLIWGVLPGVFNSHISWEAHLFGAIAGIFTAYAYKKNFL